MDITNKKTVINDGVNSIHEGTIVTRVSISYVNRGGQHTMQKITDEKVAKYRYDRLVFSDLTYACYMNNLEEVKKLIDIVDVNTVPLDKFNEEINKYYMNITSKRTQKNYEADRIQGNVPRFTKDPNSDYNHTFPKINRNDYTAIHKSPLYEVLRVPIYNADTLAIVKLLIGKGANINYKDKSTLLELIYKQLTTSDEKIIQNIVNEILNTSHTDQIPVFVEPLKMLVKSATDTFKANKNNELARKYVNLTTILLPHTPDTSIATDVENLKVASRSTKSILSHALGMSGGRRTRFRKSRRIRRTRRNR